MEAATAGLSDGELGSLRLAERKWSAAEILEHLRLTFSSTARVMAKVATAPLPVRRATLKEWIATAVVIRLGYMPSGREAPDLARPRQVEVNGIRTAFRQALSDMDRAMERCEHAKATTQKIAPHPILGPLSLREWRKFHLVHTRHHMAQIRRMRHMNKTPAHLAKAGH